MGRRHFSKPYDILNSEDISVDVTGPWTDVSQYDAVMYLLDWSGDADGEVKVEVSNDEGPSKSRVHELDFGQVISIQDTLDPKQHQILINTIAQKHMRIKYVASSGSGTMDASIVMTTKGA